MLRVSALTLDYGGVRALDGVCLHLPPGGALAVVGANGAGKTALMRCLAGLDRPRAGRILLAGRDVTRLGPVRRATLGFGYCPEGRRVFPGLTVRENLEVACRAPAAERRRRFDAMAALFPALGEKAAARAWTLSGGQQQMVAIARALMTGPRVLLLDEPSLGLAPLLAEQVFARLPAIRASGVAVLLAEQNAAWALRFADEVAVLTLGRITRRSPAAALAAEDLADSFLGAPPDAHPTGVSLDDP
ncbi:MAG: ABC transporter ATP-binding protein [Acetobacteraceae bacterium]